MWVYTTTPSGRKILELEHGVRIELKTSQEGSFLTVWYQNDKAQDLCGPFPAEQAKKRLDLLARIMGCQDMADEKLTRLSEAGSTLNLVDKGTIESA